MSLLSLDPGKRGCGVALFTRDVLVSAAYVPNPSQSEDDLVLCVAMSHAVVAWWKRHVSGEQAPRCSKPTVYGPLERVVAERPRIYVASKQRGKTGNWRDPNDLPPLFGVDTGVASLLWPVPATSYWPRDWKGTLDKDEAGPRILARLSTAETATIEDAGKLTHNIIDAIGIGLHHLNRGLITARVRVYPR